MFGYFQWPTHADGRHRAHTADFRLGRPRIEVERGHECQDGKTESAKFADWHRGLQSEAESSFPSNSEISS